MFVALVLVHNGRHLVLVDGEHQLLHLQAAVVVDGVEIGDLTVLVVKCSMEIIALAYTDARVNQCSVVGRIDRQIEADDAVATVDALVGVGLLARLAVFSAIEIVTLA